MGSNDKFRFAYDPLAALQNCEKLLGMELRPCGPNKLCGGYYINGEPHPYRRDKLKVFISRGSVWIAEEGGVCVSLPTWLTQYGGAADYKDALRMIKGESQALHWNGEIRQRKSGEVKYVGKEVLEAAKRYDLKKCPLFRWMCGMFPEDKVREAWDRYNVTTDSNGLAVFWVLDRNGRILHDKRMKYQDSGHRDKSFGGTRVYRTADGYSGRAAFGSHLIPDSGDILVTESEKSAVGLYLWTGKTVIATAGKSNLRERDPRLICYPDKDGFEEWEATGNRCIRWFDDWELPYEQQPATADVMDMIEWKILNNRK